MVLSTSTHTHINLVDELSLEDVMTKMGKIVRVVTIIQIVRAVTIIWVFLKMIWFLFHLLQQFQKKNGIEPG